MKRISGLFALLLSIVFIIGLRSSVSASAQTGDLDFIDSDIRNGEYLVYESGEDLYAYQYFDNGVEIIAYVGESRIINIPSSINGYEVVSIGPNAFLDIETVVEVVIPDTVKTIYNSGFRSCDFLEKVVIGDGVVSLGDYSFAYCDSLHDIKIGNSLTEIGFGAFGKCLSLEKIKFTDSVISLGAYAFKGNEKLKTVVLGKNIKIIGDSTFYECVSLEDISAEGVTEIGDSAFYCCFSLKNISFSDDLTSVGNEAFLGCINLPELPVGSKTQEIGDRAFMGNYALKKLIFNENVNSIGAQAFEGCMFVEEAYFYDRDVGIDGTGIGLRQGKVSGISQEEFLEKYTECVISMFYSDADRADEILAELSQYMETYETPQPFGTIYGYLKSTAETYAIENNINFIPLDSECEHKNTEIKEAKSATCTEEGYTGDTYCMTCFEKVETGTVIEKLGHSYISKVTTEATCTEEGVLTYSCSCGDSYTVEIERIAHTEVIDKAVAASCSETGLTEGKHCSACDTVIIKQSVISATGHKFANYKLNNDATCEADGTKTAFCDNGCGVKDTVIDKVSATGHKYGKDGICISCSDYNESYDENSKPTDCSCNCHKSGFMGFIWKILRFFYKLFKTNQYCACGIAHY